MHFLPSVFDGNLEHYFSVIRGGIAVRSHYDLLNWLQGEMQRYLPHKIMFAVWVDGDANRVEYDVVSTLPGVRTGFIHVEKLFSLQRELYSVWLELGHVPYRRSLGARNFRTGNCSPSCTTNKVFRGCGLYSCTASAMNARARIVFISYSIRRIVSTTRRWASWKICCPISIPRCAGSHR